MKFHFAYAAVLVARGLNRAAAAAENMLFSAASKAQDVAWNHGLAREGAKVDAARANLEAARRTLIAADSKAKAALRAQSENIDAIRVKVYG